MTTRPPRFYLAAWIAHAELTLDEVAHRSGLSRTHVAQLKAGKRRWNEDVVLALARALDLVDALDLFRDPADVADIAGLLRRVPETMQPTARRILRGLAEPDPPPSRADAPPSDVSGPNRRRRSN